MDFVHRKPRFAHLLLEVLAVLLVAAVFLFALVASAQTVLPADPVAEAVGTPWWVPVLLAFFGILSTVVTKVLLPLLASWLEAKKKTEEAAGHKTAMLNIALKVEHFAEVVHADLDATMKPAIAKALEDGKVTQEELSYLRGLALDRMKALLGQQGIAELGSVLGLVGSSAIDHYLAGVVEKRVDEANAARPPTTLGPS